MTPNEKKKEGLFSYLDLQKTGVREQVSDTVVMAFEFMKYQGEVAYEIGKRQAIAIASTASTVGIGWSAFFFGIALESWFTSSIGLMMVFEGTYILAYWTPKLMDKARLGLDAVAAAKFYKKWLVETAKPSEAEEQ